MANDFETSFIPQQPLLKVEGTTRRREAVSFALILAFIVFLVTLGVAGGLYLKKRSIEKEVADYTQQLVDAEKRISVDDIDKFKKIELRLGEAKKLLSAHVAFTTVFDLLEETVAENVMLTQLSYVQSEESLKVALSGLAKSYSAVYYQIEQWKKMAPMVKSVTLGSVELNLTRGVIQFKVDIILSPEYIRYSNVVAAETARVSTSTAPSVAPAATTSSGITPVPPGRQ
jgi:hypothetical protein